MRDHLLQKEDLTSRLRWLMFFRVAIVTFLFGIAAFIQIKGTESLPAPSLTSVYFIITTTYFLSFLYLILLKRIKSLKINVYIQAICDVTLITALVHATGGIESVYSVLYPLVIIYSTLFLAKKGGIIVASAGSLFYGLLLDLEYYGVIHPIYSPSWDYDFSAGYVLSRIFIHIVSFYIVAFLVSFVVEQEKSARSLLAEKESEFYQLDLLHRSIIESVSAGIITINLQRDIKSFNKAAEEITGLLFSEVTGKRIDKVFPGFSEILDKIKDKKSEKEAINRAEIIVPGESDKSIVLGFSVSSLINSKKEEIGEIVIFQDLTASKEMEKEVEKSKRLALIGEMAAGLAHEVRNPLAALCGSIQMLQKNLTLNATNERLMQIVLRGRDQLENLVKNFLLLARPNLSDREEINIKNIIDDVLESLRNGPDWHEDIKAVVKLCNPSDIYGNKTEMQQMLWNLVLNAVQSMPDGGRLKIETKLIDNEMRWLEIRISDSGYGIKEEDHGKVVEPFYTTKEKGTGLGLAIVSRIVESHGGKMKIESELQKGTTCMILLPRRRTRKNNVSR
ncbi:MAG: PAS domain S-box protein [Deltaproteobacteria bacterium]|nr:PAS domain S-box protein [Deltaproteobacteria bacterium]